MLYNLIDNAIKFSNNDSTITVETTEKHGKVFVSVKDTGCGIPKASITKIWERFYKLDASRGKDRKGTGLGLSIVKRSSLRITRISMSSVQRALVPNLSLHSPKAKHQNKPLRRGAFLPDISN